MAQGQFAPMTEPSDELLSDERISAIFRNLARKCRKLEEQATAARAAHREHVASLLDEIAARIEAGGTIDAVPVADILFTGDASMSELETLALRSLGATDRPMLSVPHALASICQHPPAGRPLDSDGAPDRHEQTFSHAP